MIEPGDKAPSFSLPGDRGGDVSLADFAGKALVLYFYPRDDTPGCTTEALGFTQSIGAFQDAGAAVVGVSKDPVASHCKFVEKHGLAVQLLSDEASDVCERYGVWQEKSMYGKKFMGIERSTFLIDAGGVVRQVWRKVKVPGHVEAVLEAVRAL